MKTLTRLMQTVAVAAALGCGNGALADHSGGGPGRGFGGRPEHGRRDDRIERRGGHGDHGEYGGHGGGYLRAVPFPFLPLPRLFVPPPLPPVRVLLPPPPVEPVCRPRVVLNVNDCRRIAQPMVHGHAAVIEVRVGIGRPWVVIGEHPSIW